MDEIRIHNAKEHNLAGVSITLPRDSLVVFTGVSGSGKSSLAFDTIFSEGQRRYVESLNSYARQFIGQFEKPDVESIDGLSPAIAIDQKTVGRSPRSTVGTVTEIYDFLRLLFARIGTPYHPETGAALQQHTEQDILNTVWGWEEGTKLQVLSPVVRGRKGEYNALFNQSRKEGFVRIRIDGQMKLIEEIPEDFRLERNKLHNVELVVDRIVLKHDEKTRVRLAEAIQGALKKSDGYVIVQDMMSEKDHFFSRHLALPTGEAVDSEMEIDEVSPRLFSFNSPYGACPRCEGLGVQYAIAESLLVPDPKKSLVEGAIAPFEKLTGRYYQSFLKKIAKRHDLRTEVPYQKLSEREKDFIMFGGAEGKSHTVNLEAESSEQIESDDYDWFDFVSDFDGVMNILKRRFLYGSESMKSYIQTFMTEETCPDCQGARLKPFSLSIKLGDKNIYEVCQLSIREALAFVQALPEGFTDFQQRVGQQALFEVEQRLRFLIEVGLDYLTLARAAATLSGGEAQRIRLASQIGSGLSGVLYILDEPSIGLHQYNNQQLINTLCRLRDQGNSLIVVEHDEDTIRTADWVVDIGPHAGVHGGHVVAQGKPKQIEKSKESLTGQYLSGKRQIAVPKKRRKGSGDVLTVEKASFHNLKDVTIDFPLGKLISVTGLSGSGKSTLVFDVLYKAVRYHLGKFLVRPEGYAEIHGLEHIDKMIDIDQSPIGRTSRSNPATYTGLFDAIRNLFASSEDSKIRGYKPGRFSFNVKGGRCEACRGEGMITKEMNFLPDVHIVCEVCEGQRYNSETLEVKFQEHSIADVLDMTVSEAVKFFERYPKIQHQLQVLEDVGLGYIQLGQPAPTLSGGEAQRVKLATEFCRRSTGKTLYLLDEPTTGLHWYDLENLIGILNRLTDQGNTVVVIEHNLDFIKVSDHVIDMGPEGGERGGYVVAQGTPEQVAQCEDSYTGQFLKRYLG